MFSVLKPRGLHFETALTSAWCDCQMEKADFAEEKDKKHAKEMYPFNQIAVFLMQARL